MPQSSLSSPRRCCSRRRRLGSRARRQPGHQRRPRRCPRCRRSRLPRSPLRPRASSSPSQTTRCTRHGARVVTGVQIEKERTQERAGRHKRDEKESSAAIALSVLPFARSQAVSSPFLLLFSTIPDLFLPLPPPSFFHRNPTQRARLRRDRAPGRGQPQDHAPRRHRGPPLPGDEKGRRRRQESGLLPAAPRRHRRAGGAQPGPARLRGRARVPREQVPPPAELRRARPRARDRGVGAGAPPGPGRPGPRARRGGRRRGPASVVARGLREAEDPAEGLRVQDRADGERAGEGAGGEGPAVRAQKRARGKNKGFFSFFEVLSVVSFLKGEKERRSPPPPPPPPPSLPPHRKNRSIPTATGGSTGARRRATTTPPRSSRGTAPFRSPRPGAWPRSRRRSRRTHGSTCTRGWRPCSRPTTTSRPPRGAGRRTLP